MHWQDGKYLPIIAGGDFVNFDFVQIYESKYMTLTFQGHGM